MYRGSISAAFEDPYEKLTQYTTSLQPEQRFVAGLPHSAHGSAAPVLPIVSTPPAAAALLGLASSSIEIGGRCTPYSGGFEE